MTQQEMPAWSNPMEYQENSFEDEGLRLIQAAIAAKNTQRPNIPWNIPPQLWRTLSREQQKLWIDLREAARVRGSKSSTPPFKLRPGLEDQYEGINRQENRFPRPNPNRRANQTLTEEEEEEEPEEEEVSPPIPEDPEQAAFEEDNLNDDQKR